MARWRPKPAVNYGPPSPVAQSERPIDAGVGIGHVHLKAKDLGRIRDFYVGVLGFDVVMETDDALFLAAGGYHHHLAFNTWHTANGVPPPSNATGLYHVALRYPSLPSLADALRRLVQVGWPLEGASDHGTHVAIYLRDPEQNGLELEWDRPQSEWPLDEDGKLAFVGGSVDLMALLELS